MSRRVLPAALLFFSALALACGGGDDRQPTEPSEPRPQVTTVTVSPSSAELNAVGATKDFEATARDQNGNEMSGISFTWSVSDTAVASVDDAGTVTARGDGSALVRAAAEGVADSASLSVKTNAAPAPAAVSERLPARLFASAVWNEGEEHVLVFGGSDRRTFSGTWRYDPGEGSWQKIEVSGAPKRKVHSAVWADERDVMYVFGGNTGEVGFSQTNDLWRLDPSDETWTKLAPAGGTPKARANHSAVWDPVHEQMLIFGGRHRDQEYLQDLWAYRPEANEWAELSDGPLARASASAVWMPGEEAMLVFGGRHGTRYLQDLWRYDPAADEWTKVGVSSPPPKRFRHKAVWDDASGRMLVYGGCCGPEGQFDGLWSYDPEQASWRELSPAGPRPTAKQRHVAAWSPVHRAMLVYGGSSDGDCFYQNDLWAFVPRQNRWKRLSPLPRETPVARMDHGAAVLDGKLYSFGGCMGSGASADLVRVGLAGEDPETLSPAGHKPPARIDPTLVSVDSADQLLLFGGRGPEGAFGDLWRYAVPDGQWKRLTPDGEAPTPRYVHAAAWSDVRRTLYVFGGKTSGGRFLGDLWAYDRSEDSWQRLSDSTSGPGPRSLSRMVWDPSEGRLLLYAGWWQDVGGTFAKETYRDIWAFEPDGGGWSRIEKGGSGPEHRVFFSMTWDPVAERIRIFGGNYFPHLGGDFLSELWSYDPSASSWREIAHSGPSVRTRQAATWSPDREAWIVTGGYGGPEGRFLNEIWRFRPARSSWQLVHP